MSVQNVIDEGHDEKLVKLVIDRMNAMSYKLRVPVISDIGE